jgi:YHS domain-containing protein
VQQDAAEMVTRSMSMWLHRDGTPVGETKAYAAVINRACPFSGDAVRADSITLYEGKVVGFCNTACRDKFANDPQTYLEQIPELASKGK